MAPTDKDAELVWPPTVPPGLSQREVMLDFAQSLVDELSEKGWFLIRMRTDEVTSRAALSQARSLPGTSSLKAELLPDYLGHEGRGKIAILDYDGLNNHKVEENLWALSELDRELTQLARALAPLTVDALGFKASGRRKGMVWVPFASEEERRRLMPAPLADEDIEAGVLDAHQEFLRGRRLCFSHWVRQSGGSMELQPRPDAPPEVRRVRLPLASGRLLGYRCDLLEPHCRPLGDDALSLTTWVMADAAEAAKQLSVAYAQGDALAVSEALGIFEGPLVPLGHRMHIMAMHTHLPGNVHNEDEFPCLFASGCDGFLEIPHSRFDKDIYCTPDGEKDYFRSYARHASVLNHEELTYFANGFFGIPDEEAKAMAPTQRLILEDGYATLHKAGFTRQTLKGRATAFYVGDTGAEWDPLSSVERLEVPLSPHKLHQPFGNVVASRYSLGGMDKHITAGRLSYVLGLRGPTMSVDTACSASLVGVATATQALRRTDSSQSKATLDQHSVDALCTGISGVILPFGFIALCGPSMLARKGRCFTFDVGAEGYARGDGYGGVYLKPGDSEEDSVNQLSCLMGCVVNQDGRSATLTAPNGMAQQACIRDSMREAGVVANQITIAECHGTGTALGDPIEVGALRGVMEPRQTPLLTTSAKSNIGHLEACAGIIGLLKCVVITQASHSPPNIHLRNINPHLDVEGFPAYFETEASDTCLNSNYAGVSSFGFSGTNARADIWSQCRRGAHMAIPD